MTIDKKVKVTISPYIPLNPDPSSKDPVNGYFGIYISYEKNSDLNAPVSDSLSALTVTISGFVRENEDDTTAIFNTSDEFATFVDHLQFKDTKMMEDWKFYKADGNNQLIIKQLSGTPPPDDFICLLECINFNPTNPKGDDSRAKLSVNIKYRSGYPDQYEIYSNKIYLSDVLTFHEVNENYSKQINEEFTLEWICRGDYVDSAYLQVDTGPSVKKPIEGNCTVSCSKPTTFKLTVQNNNQMIPFTASAYLSIQMVPPKILFFQADRSYVFQGDSVVLSWEAVSAYTCQINRGEESYAVKASTTVTPDFNAEADEHRAGFRLTALGFKVDKPYAVEKSLLLTRTFWEKRQGAIQGIDLSKITQSQTGSIFFDGSSYYIFDGNKIWGSSDGLSYHALSELPLDTGYTLNNAYHCGFYDGKFYIAGIQKDSAFYIASYNTDAKNWDNTWVSDDGDRFINGIFAADRRYDIFYYVFYEDNTVFLYCEYMTVWSLAGSCDFKDNITSCACCCREDRLYLSVGYQSEIIENYSVQLKNKGVLGDIVKNCTIYSAEQVLTLMPTDNHILLLEKNAIYDAVTGRQLDICPNAVLAGMDDDPIMICKEKEGYQRYKLHEKEIREWKNKQ